MRILTVTAEETLARAIMQLLQSHNFTVDWVSEEVSVVDYLKNGSYSGTIIDVSLPGGGGISLLRELRGRDIRLPVLLLTRGTNVAELVRGLDGGANDCLAVPFDPLELVARLRAMTRGRAMSGSSTLSLGNVTLDRATYQLSTPTGSVRLTRKEFQVLEILLTNTGKLTSTEKFLETIWGYDCDCDLHVVWVYISYLRRKLKDLNANIRIRAIRNAGYSLVQNLPPR